MILDLSGGLPLFACALLLLLSQIANGVAGCLVVVGDRTSPLPMRISLTSKCVTE